MRFAVAFVLAALMLVPSAAAGHVSAAGLAGPRILYSSDWTGPTEIFAADPSGRAPVRQVTFARPDGGCLQRNVAEACGYTRPQPSPDGHWLAYWSVGPDFKPTELWLARADGANAREIGVGSDADWSPNSRSLVYSAEDGIHVATTAGADRIAYRAGAYLVQWSPDGRTIAFADNNGVSLLRGGLVQILVRDEPDSLAWSPDGHQIAYATKQGIFFISTRKGRHSPRLAYSAAAGPDYFRETEWGLTFSPDGRLVAFHDRAKLGFLDTRTLRVRTFGVDARDIAWSPDGTRLLVVRGSVYHAVDPATITTGDLQTITPRGQIQTSVSASGAYGGQIISAAWATPAAGFAYQPPQPVTGLFAGGPVDKLVADGDRVAFVACGGVSTGVPTTGEVDTVVKLSFCPASVGRDDVATLALAGDRLLWWTAHLGNGYLWSVRETTIGGIPVEVAKGIGSLGGPAAIGAGTAVGSGSLLAMSSWKLHFVNNLPVVDQETIQRVDAGGCPCLGISSSPGLYVPLDVDANRIVASGNLETRVLAADGTILLSLPVPTLAAQLSGSQLVLATGSTLRVYDAGNGVLVATWPLPGLARHDCDTYGDASCFGFPPPPVTLEDVAHGLAAYVVDGQVHLLRLSDGADRTVVAGTLARFTNAGLVYADGARIWLAPYDQLPLR